MTPERDWTVLLIGGGSCTGKSTLAADLARTLDLHVVDTDIIWLILRRTVPSEVAPDLQFSGESWSLPPDELVERYLRVSNYISRALEIAIHHYLRIGRRTIFEGTWMLPQLAVQGEYDGHPWPLSAVRAVYLHEPDLDQLTQRLVGRPDGWFRSQPERFQHAQAAMHHLYGNEIKRQAEALNLPVLQSRPFDTLLDRALAALDLSQ